MFHSLWHAFKYIVYSDAYNDLLIRSLLRWTNRSQLVVVLEWTQVFWPQKPNVFSKWVAFSWFQYCLSPVLIYSSANFYSYAAPGILVVKMNCVKWGEIRGVLGTCSLWLSNILLSSFCDSPNFSFGQLPLLHWLWSYLGCESGWQRRGHCFTQVEPTRFKDLGFWTIV